MTKITIKQLVWDDFNTQHIKKHGVTVAEVEAATQQVIAHQKAKQGRYAVFVKVGVRILTLILKRKKSITYYVVTARDAAKKERKLVYEKENK